MSDLYVVVLGHAFDGIQLIGPFLSTDEASNYASENYGGLSWEIVKVYTPEEA